MRRWLAYFVLALVIITALGFVTSLVKREFVKSVSIFDLLDKIQAGEIKSIAVGQTQLLAELKNGGFITAPKESRVSFWEILKDSSIPAEKIRAINIKTQEFDYSGLIFSLLINILPFLVIAWIFWQIFSQAQKGAGQIFTFSKSGVRIYNPQKDRVTFQDVAGLKEAKEEVQEIIEFLKNPSRFINLGAQIPKGVLLVGPPGSGKTLLARATACESNVPFLHISGSEFVELFVGVGAGRVRDTFAMAKKLAPSILFIDELDAVGRARSIGIGGSHEEREQTLNQILVEMDGLEKNAGVIILAASNRPDVLDQALLRPGRFDRKIILDLPDIREREEILKIHLRNKKIGKVNLHEVAERTSGFSGADLANLANEAAILAARHNKSEITQTDLLLSIEKVLLGPERRSKVLSKQEKEVAAYHEAGHAIVAHYLPHAAPVQKISIISRGRAGGYTIKTPLEEKNFHFKREFFDELAVLLGGYAAELLKFNDVSTGASSDLQVATDLARQLITRYGMSDNLGPMALEKIHGLTPFDRTLVERDYSEKTAELIDTETKTFLEQALERAKSVLKQKQEKFVKLAETLLKRETLEKRQFERLISEPKGALQIA
jgi:cell division protease FtsH